MRTRRVLALSCVILLFLALGEASARSTATDVAQPDGKFIELKRPTPKWYTPALHRRVLAAGRVGKTVPIPPRVKLPQSALLFTGIRPGSWMISPAWCTMNFVFGSAQGNIGLETAQRSPATPHHRPEHTQGQGSGVYIGTAGHCTGVGEEVVLIAAPGVLMNIGRTVQSVDQGVGDDFALVEIDPAFADVVNPSIAIIAGPTGAANPTVGTVIEHVGHGLGIGTGGTPRVGVVGFVGPVEQPFAYGWVGAVSPGDSGSATRSATGAATGNVTHLYIEGTKYLPGIFFGTTIDRMLQIAGAPLATASLVPDPLP